MGKRGGKLKRENPERRVSERHVQKGGVIGPVYDCVFFLGLVLGFGWIFFFGAARQILRCHVSRVMVLIGSVIGPMCIILCSFWGLKLGFV